MPEHFSFLFQYLKKQEIWIDKEEFTFQVQSHPDYPSLLSISDTLSFLKINNFATNISSLADLPERSIALVDKEKTGKVLAFVEKINSGYQYTQNGKTVKVSNNEFSTIFRNIVLVTEKGENEETKPSVKKAGYAPFAILALIYVSVLLLNGFDWTTFTFLSITLLGLYFSIEATSSELGINTKFSEAVCGGTPTNTDCNTVITSTKNKLLEIVSFSEISITFFVAQLLSILLFSITKQLPEFYNLTLISLLFSVPVTFYSFYIQKFIEKKWCTICLLIIAVLYTELLFLLLTNTATFSISFIPVLYYSFALIFSYLLSVSFKRLLKSNFELKSEIVETNRFKRNYSIFKMTLVSSGKINTNENIATGNIILGNPKSKLKIILVTSPYCGYCSNAHTIIEKILDLYKNKVAIHIRFNINPLSVDAKGKAVFEKLINIYFNKGQGEFMNAMQTWFSTKDEAKLLAYDTQTNDKIDADQLLLEQHSWNQKNNTNFTPALIINDYLYPTQYSRDELLNFIADLEDDETF